MKKQKFYTLQQAADLLAISERSMYRYIKSGKLKAVKIGYWRINPKDLKQLLDKGTKQKKK